MSNDVAQYGTEHGALTLYHSHRACSLACLIALEQAGFDYALEIVDVRTRANRRDAYLQLNPNGTVPLLTIGGERLTETHAILTYLADRATPALLPSPGSIARARAHEWMNFLATSVHPAFRAIFKPAFYGGDDGADAVRAHGFARLPATLADIARRLGERSFVLGDAPSAPDFYAFVFLLWSTDERIGGAAPLPPVLAAYASRMIALPAVRRALALSGIIAPFAVPA
jgi:glutathione S-transferase